MTLEPGDLCSIPVLFKGESEPSLQWLVWAGLWLDPYSKLDPIEEPRGIAYFPDGRPIKSFVKPGNVKDVKPGEGIEDLYEITLRLARQEGRQFTEQFIAVALKMGLKPVVFKEDETARILGNISAIQNTIGASRPSWVKPGTKVKSKGLTSDPRATLVEMYDDPSNVTAIATRLLVSPNVEPSNGVVRMHEERWMAGATKNAQKGIAKKERTVSEEEREYLEFIAKKREDSPTVEEPYYTEEDLQRLSYLDMGDYDVGEYFD